MSNLSEVRAIVTGADTLVALLRDGTVKTWGPNACGQLRTGTTTDSHDQLSVG